LPLVLANSVIKTNETLTAAVITRTSSTLPTAVMIESGESTMSPVALGSFTAAKVACDALDTRLSSPSRDSRVSPVRLPIGNRPPIQANTGRGRLA
jgi:hypothetical protein